MQASSRAIHVYAKGGSKLNFLVTLVYMSLFNSMENTETMSADPQPDWGLVLPREGFHAVMRGLHRSLPSSDTDTPEDWARRDRAAMAAVGALRPADAMEGELAAQIVSARAWAKDCLQLAVDRQDDFGAAVKCKAQALSMMREVKSAWNLLLKVQVARRAVEQDDGRGVAGAGAA